MRGRIGTVEAANVRSRELGGIPSCSERTNLCPEDIIAPFPILIYNAR